MRKLVAFEPKHLAAIAAAMARAAEARGAVPAAACSDLQQRDRGEALIAAGDAWSLIDGRRVIACGGIVHQHEQFGIAWAMFDPTLSGADMLAAHRAVSGILSADRRARIQIAVDPQHGTAGRWLRMLGFEFEALMRRYTPAGADQFRFARIRVDDAV